MQTAQDRTVVEMKATATSVTDGGKGSPSRPLKEETRKYGTSREAISNKYAAMRQQSRQVSNPKPVENNITFPSSGLASTWRSMKSGFQNFKANIEAKKFLPLRQNPETKLVSRVNSSDSESLDEIFQRLKRPSIDHSDEDENENETEIKITGSRR